MARFKIEMTDGSSRHIDAQRLVVGQDITLQRRHGDSWQTVSKLDPERVACVRKRHTDLNGAWLWVRVYPESGASGDRAVPAWERSW